MHTDREETEVQAVGADQRALQRELRGGLRGGGDGAAGATHLAGGG